MTMASTSSKNPLLRFDFIGLCLVIFLTYCNTTVFYSLYVYLRSIGIAQQWRGFLIGASALATIGCFLAFSHKLNRANAASFAYLGAALLMGCGVFYLFTRDFGGLLVLRLVNGVGVYLLSASCMTLLVSVIPGERSGQAFSLYSVAYLLPYSIVPAVFDALGGALPSFAHGYAAMAMTLVLAVFVIRRIGAGGKSREARPAAEDKVGFGEMCANAAKPSIALLLIINTVYIVTFSSLFFMAKGLFLSRGFPSIGYFFTCQACCMIGVRLLGNRLFDEIRKVTLIRVSFALSAVGFALAVHLDSLLGMYAAAALLGVGMGVGSPAIYALMYKISAAKFRGINSNLLMLSLQVGNFTGPILGAFIVHVLGYGGLLAANAAASLLGLVCCFLLTAQSVDQGGLARRG